jgi:glycine dehydrogenase
MRTDSFKIRHIGPQENEQLEMLQTCGTTSINDLINKTIPSNIRLNKALNLPEALSEQEYMAHILELEQLNKEYKTYIGLGYHPTIMPGVIQRNILENPGWYTAYTPYQAEISQGRLEALLNYQTMISDLTGMEVTNASLLDEGTAAAEAMIMLYNTRSRKQKKEGIHTFFVSELILPQTIAILETRSKPLGIKLVIGNHQNINLTADYYGAILQYPAKYGEVYDYKEFVKKANELEIKISVAADLMSLALLSPPGEWGAHVVVGSTQRFGVPMGYGGPAAAYFSTLESYKRNIPGRIIGVTEDTDGNRALRMALQTREQHIKREKATSNICTAQVLLAVMAGMYGVYHGQEGIKYIAKRIFNLTGTLAKGFVELGIKQKNKSYFDTLLIEVKNTEVVKKLAEKKEINFWYIDANTMSISINELTRLKDINEILTILSESEESEFNVFDTIIENTSVSDKLIRSSAYMTQDVFKLYHSETEMMRYIKKLENRDLSLNQSMISLGSCTMKLNSATSMIPLSWHSWGDVHPFAPKNQAKGYAIALKGLEDALSEITGFYATSLQPNSGAQGEYAGLLVIREYLESIGQENRNIILIPASAHGTNPASAVMAGGKVVVINTTENGNIDVDDLREKASLHADNLAALMVTYPSTHGVFESAIKEITQIIHKKGGLVYMDGANMNAQVGLTNPAIIGADVCHLNLHKTFAIPHGGGGPGVGPICCTKDLAPFLPGNPIINTGGEKAISAVSSAPWGSAFVTIISYAYIKMLGAEGLTKSTQIAILNANYLKTKLAAFYPILYTGETGFVGHEMIVDFRDYKKKGVEVTDVAKRLMDYGYHSPTVSFPVAGTLMIEPTESENKAELDRFISAMASIKDEIDAHSFTDHDSPLKNAPHTQDMLTAENWPYKYSRETAAFPLEYIRENKFWPFVRRVNEAYGDRHLVCSCLPIEDYMD